jgi:ABC-type transport system involved in multi-copper enzyme maturation permease subunit
MIGAILFQEQVFAGHRKSRFPLSYLYICWVLFLLCRLLWSYGPIQILKGFHAPELIGCFACDFVDAFGAHQLLFWAVLVPPFTVGALIDEKTHGTLQELLLTDLSARDIILGKLLGRTAPFARLALFAVPLFVFFAAFAAVGPVAIVGWTVISGLQLLAIGAGSLLAGVWCTKLRDAVLAAYGVAFGGYLLARWLGADQVFDTAYVLEPTWDAGAAAEIASHVLLCGLAWGSLAILTGGLAVWRLRPAYLRETARPDGASTSDKHAVRRPEVGDDPVYWKERYVEGFTHARFLRRLPTTVSFGIFFTASLALTGLTYWNNLPPDVTWAELLEAVRNHDFSSARKMLTLRDDLDHVFRSLGLALVAVASLLAGVRGAVSISGERERDTWEPLLLTAISAREIFRGKLRGIMAATHLHLFALALPLLVWSAFCGILEFYQSACFGILAVLQMYIVGGMGIHISLITATTRQSLFHVLGCWAGWSFAFFFYGVACAGPFIDEIFELPIWPFGAIVVLSPLTWYFVRGILANAEKYITNQLTIRQEKSGLL